MSILLQKRAGELVFLFLIMIVSIGTLQIASGYRMLSRQFPTVIAWMMLIFIVWEIILFIHKMIKEKDQVSKPAKKGLPSDELIKRWAVIIAALIFYVFFLRRLGFVIVNAVFITVILWVFEERRIPIILFMVLLLAVGLYIGFSQYLNVPLPRGTIFSSMFSF